MTQLRQTMLEELQRRHYSDRTAKTYIRIVRDFAAYFRRPPDQLGPEQIRQYQAYLFQSKKLSPATVSQYVSALRFLLVKTLRRHFMAEHIPFPKSPRRLPVVLSVEEVARAHRWGTQSLLPHPAHDPVFHGRATLRTLPSPGQ
jgi:integrase/recombinase XerD